MTWQQQYPGQGAPPPAGFQVPNAGYGGGYSQPGGYPQFAGQPGGYPQQPGSGYSSFPAAPPPAFMPHPPMDDYENGNFGGSTFTDPMVRKGFIRKVYSILMCQMLITMGFIALFLYHEPTKRFAQQNSYLYIVGFVALMAVMITLACCGDVRRRSPINIILLGIYTVIQAFMLGTISAFYKVDEVMMAVGITAAVCLALTLFAFQTKWDFTAMGGILMCCCVVLLLFGIVAIFIPGNKIVSLVYGSLGALLFSVYLVYDTQLIMGGNHKYSTSPEEYIFAALNLYVDIVNIFLMILTIIGASRD